MLVLRIYTGWIHTCLISNKAKNVVNVLWGVSGPQSCVCAVGGVCQRSRVWSIVLWHIPPVPITIFLFHVALLSVCCPQTWVLTLTLSCPTRSPMVIGSHWRCSNPLVWLYQSVRDTQVFTSARTNYYQIICGIGFISEGSICFV